MYSEDKMKTKQVDSGVVFGIKECPICHARCFSDMEVCYGCLYSFTKEEDQKVFTEIACASDNPKLNRKSDTVSQSELTQSFQDSGAELHQEEKPQFSSLRGAASLTNCDIEDAEGTENKELNGAEDTKNDTEGTEENKEIKEAVVAFVNYEEGKEMPSVSLQTQTALADLLEIVISVRAPQDVRLAHQE